MQVANYRIPNLGYWAGRVLLLIKGEAEAHEDVDVFYAPSESHDDVRRSYGKAHLELQREFEKITGMPYHALFSMIREAASYKWMWRVGIDYARPDTVRAKFFPIEL